MFLFPLFYVIREFHRFLHRGKAGGMSLWHGMWHDLRNGIIMRNVILAE